MNSLVVVLLHNGNKFPSVPIAYTRKKTESFDTMKLLLRLINYDKYEWVICCDLKVVGLLTGVRGGFAKCMCFLCKWEGRKRSLHYTNHKWPERTLYEVGEDSIDRQPLVSPTKIILPPLHIKLGMIKSFLHKLRPESDAFTELKRIFPKLSDSKLIAGK